MARHTGGVNQQRIADAVVVAAGRSRRMGGQDKLEAEIAGRSILRWSVEAMACAPDVARVVVVTAPARVGALAEAPWLRSLRARVVAGGDRRQESVAAGVQATQADVVLVHDAARPLVSSELIARVVEAVVDRGAVVPVLPIVDALKAVDAGRVAGSAERGGLFRAQTPQGARGDLLRAAVEAHAGGPDVIADEAELLARDGVSVFTVPGEATNIKVTLPADLDLARRLAREGAGQRVAFGYDSHPFGPDSGLRLAGLSIEAAPRLHGHSDGDVVLHALCDALLGAARLGDLGRHFPAGEPASRDIDSRGLVHSVVRQLRDAGLAPGSADVTILAARPRLGGERLDAMAESIAALIGVPALRVSVKAASGNLGGDEGAGRTISATCLVSVVAP